MQQIGHFGAQTRNSLQLWCDVNSSVAVAPVDMNQPAGSTEAVTATTAIGSRPPIASQSEGRRASTGPRSSVGGASRQAPSRASVASVNDVDATVAVAARPPRPSAASAWLTEPTHEQKPGMLFSLQSKAAVAAAAPTASLLSGGEASKVRCKLRDAHRSACAPPYGCVGPMCLLVAVQIKSLLYRDESLSPVASSVTALEPGEASRFRVAGAHKRPGTKKPPAAAIHLAGA